MSQADVQVKVECEKGISQEDALAGLAGAASARATASLKSAGKKKAVPDERLEQMRNENSKLRDEYDDIKTQLTQANRLLSVFGIRTKRNAELTIDTNTLEEAQKMRRLYDIASKHPNGVDEVNRRFKLFDSQLKHRYQDTVLGSMGLAGEDIVCINWNITSFGPNMYSLASVEGIPNPDAPCELFVSLLLRPHNQMNVLPRCSLVEKVSPKNYEMVMNKVFNENNVKLIYNDYASSLPAGHSVDPYATFKVSLWNDTQRSVLTRYQELRARSIAASRTHVGS